MNLKNVHDQTEKEFLENYDPKNYERPSVSVDMTIFTIEKEDTNNYRKLEERTLKILLLQRNNHPFINQWALPGGFVRPTESTEEAAIRELKEETNVDNVYLEQLYTFSTPDRDPRMWVITCAYMALIDRQKVHVVAGEEANMVKWFDVTIVEKKKEENQTVQSMIYELQLSFEDMLLTATIRKRRSSTNVEYKVLESNGIAFDHAQIILVALERLRGKVEYTDIVFHLMPQYFTLTELQKVYELILGKSLLPANFRRKIKHLVEETDQYKEGFGHRPSKLYKKVEKSC